MIDLESYLIPKISERCKTLRAKKGYNMEIFGDKAAVSRIEKSKNVASGNFISEVMLYNYANMIDVSPQEIIFGGDNEIEECLEDLFYKLFGLITRRNLEKDMSFYKEGIFDDLDIEIQKSVMTLANAFAEYNYQRYNFLKIDEPFMRVISKDLDKMFIVKGKLINLARANITEPINENTVIDLGIFEKAWLIVKEKFILSFKSEVIDNLFNDFKFTNINGKTNQWIKQQFIKVIVPNVVIKLKSNSIFKIGYMVQNLIDEFLDEDLPTSYQKTIPIQIKRNKYTRFTLDGVNYQSLSKEKEKEFEELYTKIQERMFSGKNLDDIPQEKLSEFGFHLDEIPEFRSTKEVQIDDLIDRAMSKRNEWRVKANSGMRIEQGPIVKTDDFSSFQEMDEFFDDYFDDVHFTNQSVPGYLTNNSQISIRLQQRFNVDIHETIERFIDTQYLLLKLLTEQELLRFVK